MDDLTKLDKVLPQPLETTLGGETLQVLPIKARQLPGMIRACASFYHLLDIDAQVDIPALVASGGESVLEAVAIGLDKSVEWVGELDCADLVRAATTVLEVNVDFFIQAVLPELEKAKARIAMVNAKRIGSTTSSI